MKQIFLFNPFQRQVIIHMTDGNCWTNKHFYSLEGSSCSHFMLAVIFCQISEFIPIVYVKRMDYFHIRSFTCQEIWTKVLFIPLKAVVPYWGLSDAQYKTDTALPLSQDWHSHVLKYLRSSSSPISTPASRSMATPSRYSSLRVGSKNLNGSHGNCLLTVWISVWNLEKKKQNQKPNTK